MSIFAKGQKKNVVIDGVNFVIKKLSLEKQMTIKALYDNKKEEEGVLAMINFCLESWDAKNDDGNVVPISPEAIKDMSIDVANRLGDEIMSYNSPTKDEAKN